ncbi:hypothetical protein MRB53_013093 [Persea americana]|uniref:Uncharacterized protein n=1 Tax=Persea americana TaxID=3435 RepID=A0ACC2K7D3_PERAE|nr:hypothetical protein MRB53_013093 [Persea americana]
MWNLLKQNFLLLQKCPTVEKILTEETDMWYYLMTVQMMIVMLGGHVSATRALKFLAVVSAKREPVHFSEAVQDDRWRTAMQNEIQALQDNEAGLLGAKPAPIPLEQNHRLPLAEGALLPDPTQYQRLVGRLIYLCFTRPELPYCVHILSQFMQQPREEHWNVALHLIRYLKGQPGQGPPFSLEELSIIVKYNWQITTFNICLVVRGTVSDSKYPRHGDVDPYGAPKSMGIFRMTEPQRYSSCFSGQEDSS